MTKTPDSFQSRVAPWMHETFGAEISADRLERGDRLLEEVLELLQSGGYPAYRIARLASYVYGRPAGEPAQEVGGVMVTLAAYCLAHELDMHAAGETELARVWTKVEAIRAKQAAKPRGSALPVAARTMPDIAEILLVKRECSVCDGNGFKADGRHCGGCNGSGETMQYGHVGQRASDEINRAREMLGAADADAERLAEALSLAESVYRKNCVAPGEPSSVLDCMQAALTAHHERKASAHG